MLSLKIDSIDYSCGLHGTSLGVRRCHSRHAALFAFRKMRETILAYWVEVIARHHDALTGAAEDMP